MTSSWSGYGNGDDISGDGVGLLLPLDAGEVGVDAGVGVGAGPNIQLPDCCIN